MLKKSINNICFKIINSYELGSNIFILLKVFERLELTGVVYSNFSGFLLFYFSPQIQIYLQIFFLRTCLTFRQHIMWTSTNKSTKFLNSILMTSSFIIMYFDGRQIRSYFPPTCVTVYKA